MKKAKSQYSFHPSVFRSNSMLRDFDVDFDIDFDECQSGEKRLMTAGNTSGPGRVRKRYNIINERS